MRITQLSIIIISFKVKELLLDCLGTITNTGLDINFEVIVIYKD